VARVSTAEIEVLILGAGAAGLAAARKLQAAGITVAIIEGRDRAGGRIWTRYPGDGLAPVELGAEFVHGRHPGFWRLLRKARLTVADADGRHYLLDGRKFRRADSLFHKAAELFLRAGKSEESIKSFLRREVDLRSRLGRLALTYVEGFFAADPASASAQFIGTMARASQKIGEDPHRPLQGYARLADWMRSGLEQGGVPIHFNTRVERIRWSLHRVAVETASPTGGSTFEASRAIVTLPVGVLKTTGRSRIQFIPEVAAKAEAIRSLEMGPIVKAVLRFADRFWLRGRSRVPGDFAFLHSPGAPFPTWWRPLPHPDPMLVGWSGGLAAAKLAGLGKDAILDKAIESLSSIGGISSRRIEASLESAVIANWQKDAFSRGGYCVVPEGQIDHQAELARPVQDTLFFAGEATHLTGFAGTVHGAIETGERAAQEVERSLEKNPRAASHRSQMARTFSAMSIRRPESSGAPSRRSG
jgi:monoamine oxidase